MQARPGLVDFGCRLFGVKAVGRAGSATADLELACQRWFDQMAEHGPEHIVAHALHEAELEPIVHAAATSSGRLSAFATAHPGSPASLEQLGAQLASGSLTGLLLFPGVHGYGLHDARLVPLLELAASLSAPVVVRCGLPPASLRDEPGACLDVEAANPLELAVLADRYASIPFVIPAFGAGFLREALMAGELCENIYLGTAPGGAWRRTLAEPHSLEDLFERALGVFGAERLLFTTGSDATPAGWRADLATLQREALGALELEAADVALILAGNARRLLQLS